MLGSGGMMMKENRRFSEAALTYLIVYILSAMPTTARHFLTMGKLKHFQAQAMDLKPQLAVRSTNFFSDRRKGAGSEFMQKRMFGGVARQG
jgi:hypothetical protein